VALPAVPPVDVTAPLYTAVMQRLPNPRRYVRAAIFAADGTDVRHSCVIFALYPA
jgi:hypothetical protein